MLRSLITLSFLTLMLSIPVGAADNDKSERPVWPVLGTQKHVLPHPRQLRWQEREFTAFVHFGMNTFTDREWGEGTDPPSQFNPTQLDTRQWAKTFKAAGMKLVIITAKHHDGFCLWPSQYTDYCIKNSPYKNGQGDIVGELAAACKEVGLEFGVYISPWDRHEPSYGDSPRYNKFYTNQITELLTHYGPIAEVWFDGAPGENSPLRKKQVYDFVTYRSLVRKLQPNACMFADDGPDCRWVGNEHGYAGETCWSMINRTDFAPGKANVKILNTGMKEGADWVPAECDVSIRPGWFYHTSQDDKVKTVEQLLDIYFDSVGRNGLFLLNVPPDRRGLIHENDVKTLLAFRKRLDAIFKEDLAQMAQLSATQSRSGNAFQPIHLIDEDNATFWAAEDSARQAEIELEWPTAQTFNVLMIQEEIRQGQRVESFSVEQFDGQKWQEITSATTIGYKRLLRFPVVTTSRLRISIKQATDCPILKKIGIFLDTHASEY